MRIAIEGCAHGELEKIYECIETLKDREGIDIDLLICCGDFQAVRNQNDMRAMAIPPKYYDMCTFYKYYSGEKKSPILTLFIGGNHEASNYLQELPYGGWVAPNIYYMGRAGVVKFGNLKIGGLSGIFKAHDYLQGLWESPPYNQGSLRSVYHIRSIDVFRLSQLKEKVNVMLSHDWPRGITNYGDVDNLLKRKVFLRPDIESNRLGSPPAENLLHLLKPDYWFSAHLHCQFAALVKHDDGDKETKFLALDKCLPKRRHLQVIKLPEEYDGDKLLKYDTEWLAVLKNTNHLLSVKNIDCHLPGAGGNEVYEFTPTPQELENAQRLMGNLVIDPNSFVRTAPTYKPGLKYHPVQMEPIINCQTVNFCEKLGIDDPLQVLLARSGRVMKESWEKPNTFNIELANIELANSDPVNIESENIEPTNTTTITPEVMVTKTPTRCMKLSLPAPITPMENDSEDLSQRATFFSPNSSCISSHDSSVSECATPQSIRTKKTFKRRNLEMYTIDTDENMSETSSSMTEDTPPSNKYICRGSASFT